MLGVFLCLLVLYLVLYCQKMPYGGCPWNVMMMLAALMHAISHVCVQAYGAQAVVVSIDPRRVYVADPSATQRPCVRTAQLGPQGEEYCWWQCTVKVCCSPTSRPVIA